MALAGAPDGHVAVDTAVTAATLQTASSVWLVQFPAEVRGPAEAKPPILTTHSTWLALVPVCSRPLV